MKEMRLISNAEKDKVNQIIRPKLGWNYVIIDGCVTIDEDGNEYYHIGVENPDVTNLESIKRIGEIVKETFKAYAVYNLGTRLA